jgi:hypothetical protein
VSSSSPARVRTVLGGLAAALVAAFVAAPARLAASPTTDFAGQRELTDGVRTAFVGYWRSGERAYTPQLREVVDYWFRFHVVKAVVAGLLLVIFVALGVHFFRAFVRTRERRPVLAVGGGVATVLAVFSLAVVMANIQGAVAPFASLLPMVADGDPVPGSPPYDVMVSDFARYHAVMAVISTVVTVALLAAGVLLWRRFSATDHRRTRRVLGSFAALSAVVAVAVAVVAVANATTAVDPEPALLALFNGSW